ncbi:hypothetical protein KI387_010501, partial [Taxus chinensis]
DVSSWNAMIVGYSQTGHCDESLDLLHQMQIADCRCKTKFFYSFKYPSSMLPHGKSTNG